MTHHVEQPITNVLLNYNEGQGSVNWIFQKRYLSQDLGQVFGYLRQVLERAQWPLVYYTDFHLVNLYSTFYRTSHGICPPPPEQVMVPTTRLAVTFSLRGKHYDVPKKPYRIRYNDWSYMWGDGILNAHDFFTINIPMLDYRRFKFRAMLPLNMFHTYNILSMLTKSFVMNYRRTLVQRSQSLHDYYTSCFDLHFGDFMKRKPWWLLPYNKFVWKRATNLLTGMINEDVALYYALYLYDQHLTERVQGDLGEQVLFGDDSIKSVLTESIQRFFDLKPTTLRTIDLVFPAFLFPTKSKNYIEFLTDHYHNMQDITSDLISNNQDLKKWDLYPYDFLATNLINRDNDTALLFFGE